MVAVSQLIGHVEQTVGGPISDSLGGSIAVVNAAGRHLFACREWLWSSRATATLNLVSGTNYVLLPADFAELVAIEVTNSTVTRAKRCTFAEILELRTAQLNGTGFGYNVCANWRVLAPGITGLADDTLQPVLEIWPTPSASVSDALTIIYKARWPDLVNDNTVVLLPPFAESLLVDFCRAFARGYEAEEQGSLSERLAQIHAGPVFAAAERQDSAMQANIGAMRGSMLTTCEMSDPIGDNFTVTL